MGEGTPRRSPSSVAQRALHFFPLAGAGALTAAPSDNNQMPSESTSPGADTPPTPKGLPVAKLPLPVSADHLVLLFLCLSLAFLILAATRAAVCGLLCALVHAALALAHSSRSGTAAVAACGRELGSVHALAAAGAFLAALELAQDTRM